MRFSLLTALFATSALAAPSRLADRVARRAVTKGSQPLIRVSESAEKITADGNETAHVDYSTNWSGAVLTSPPSGTTFTSAVGTFTVPTVSKGSGSASSWSSSAWVGIDGDTCGSAILQAGVDFTISSSGAVTYDSWYEWFPDYAHDFSGFSISAGNVIKITISAPSKSSGSVTLSNQSTGKSVSKTLSAPSSSATLCGQNAEWIVEDFEENGGLVPISNWGTVTFTGASAGTSSGGSVGLTGADVLDIKQGSTVYSDVTIGSTSSVTIKYV